MINQEAPGNPVQRGVSLKRHIFRNWELSLYSFIVTTRRSIQIWASGVTPARKKLCLSTLHSNSSSRGPDLRQCLHCCLSFSVSFSSADSCPCHPIAGTSPVMSGFLLCLAGHSPYFSAPALSSAKSPGRAPARNEQPWALFANWRLLAKRAGIKRHRH